MSEFVALDGLNIVEPVYTEQVVGEYKGNPLIEALPPIYSSDEAIEKLTRVPPYSPDERQLDAQYRYHCVEEIFRYFEPMDRHIDLERRFSRLIRQGYVARNPMGLKYASALQRGYRIIKSGDYELVDDLGFDTTSFGFTIIGISGMGKSTAVNRVLSFYPKAIVHSNYRSTRISLYQLPWLKVDCPHDGSLKSLCTNFFKAIDKHIKTNYYRMHGSHSNSVESLMARMQQIASEHCLGVLVIDEIQHLSAAKSGGSEKMLNFFVTLVNTIGVPVVLIGTTKALSVVQGEFRQARRGTGQGDMAWEKMDNDGYWDLLINGMWRYQWTREISPLTDEMKEVIYDESQGIIDIAVKLYVLAQWRAIALGEEVVTPKSIQLVAEESLQLVRPMLGALRTGDPREIAKYDDIRPVDMDKLCKEYERKLNARKKTGREKTPESVVSRDGELKPGIERTVVIRLLNVGIDGEIALRAVQDAIKACGDEIDVKAVTKQALEQALALSMQKETEGLVEASQPKEPEEMDDLRLIVKEGKEIEKKGYQSLQEKGYIKSPLGELVDTA